MAMTKCSECGTEISTKADACPKCGAKQVRTSGCAKVVLAFFVVIAALMVIGQCSRDGSPSSSNTRPSSTASSSSPPAMEPKAEPAPAPEPQTGSQWHYSRDKDPMGNGTTYWAMVKSSNTVSFDFPYSGPQRGTLTLRTHPRHGKDLILNIERGQFLCPSYDGCTVLVRFDDKKASRYSAASAADNSTETLFIRNYSRFAGEMLKAKQVRISADVYQEGSPVFEFDVSGFDVSKYRPEN